MDWKTVASQIAFPASGLLEVAVGRRIVLLVKSNDGVLAFQGLCPHQQARLADGTLQDGRLQCPRHLAAFELPSGTCTGGWQLAPLRRYQVRTDGDDIQLMVPMQELA